MLIGIVAVSIAGLSLWYTNALVDTLTDREKKLINLFAKAYKVIGESDYSESQSFLFLEIIETNNSIPVILTDEKGEVRIWRNINIAEGLSQKTKDQIVKEELVRMKQQYPPIEIQAPGIKQYIYYRNSDLVMQLKYYPLVQFLIIGLFGAITYLVFNFSRRAEQNKVWVGLAKETAHQLGTPLSSLMAWVEYFKADERLAGEEFVAEIEKDIYKLNVITNRFSNIGSVPQLKTENVVEVVRPLMDYLEKRISTKVKVSTTYEDEVMRANMNRSLFEWVIENLVKNAVDAMSGDGILTVEIGRRVDAAVYIDVTDSGKGMTKNLQNRVFDAGYTTKKRGWGLGLTLSKRIMENYHKGKIYVKRSEVGVGTTFRVVLG